MKLIFTQRATLFDFFVPFGMGHGLGQMHFSLSASSPPCFSFLGLTLLEMSSGHIERSHLGLYCTFLLYWLPEVCFSKWKPSSLQSMGSLSAEFLELEELTFLAACQRIVGSQIAAPCLGWLSVVRSCQFSPMWCGWSLFRGGKLEPPGHPGQAVCPSCPQQFCDTELHRLSRGRQLSWRDTVANASQETVVHFWSISWSLLLTLITSAYAHFCFTAFWWAFIPPPNSLSAGWLL